MKKILFALFVVFAFIGCTPTVEVKTPPAVVTETPDEPDTPPPPAEDTTRKVFVVNSSWQVVYETAVNARAVDTIEMTEADVIEYNSTHTDDQYFILYDEVPPIEESPLIDVFIVKPSDYSISSEYIDTERSDYVDRKSTYQLQAYAEGGILYVDNIPPMPIPVIDLRTDYEKYALYLIAADGSILGEEHCSDTDWVGLGYPSIQNYYGIRKAGFELQARADGGGEYVVAGALYTEPV